MNKDFFKNGAYFGLLMVCAFVLLDLIFYVIDITKLGIFFFFFVVLLIWALQVFAFVWGGKTYRNKFMNGYINYGKALMFCLTMAITYIIVMFGYHSLFYFVFDTGRAVHDAQNMTALFVNYIPEEKRTDIMNGLASDITNTKTVLKGLQGNIISGILFSLLAALFVRKKEKFTEVF